MTTLTPHGKVTVASALALFIESKIVLDQNWQFNGVILDEPETLETAVVYDAKFSFTFINDYREGIDVDEFVELTQSLDFLCGVEPGEGQIEVEGQTWHFGDGDDALALQIDKLQDKVLTLKTWVRTFEDEA